jgi:hypothetical protein
MDAPAYLYSLAAARALYQPQLASIDAQIAALQAQRADIQAQLDDAERETRAAIQAHVQATGDLTPHPAVQVRRVCKWAYDKDAALAAALERGDLHLVRVRRELDVRAFERALELGAPWADAEKVNDIVIAISTRLGDLLITEARDDIHA